MRCEVCGLNNDPSLDYCDNCEHPLRESTTAVLATPPRPRRAPAPVAVFDEDDDVTVAAGPAFKDPMVEPTRLGRPLIVGVAVLALAGAAGGVVLASRHGDEPGALPGTTPATSSYVEPSSAPPTTASPEPSPSPTADPAAQGAALDQLLDRSKRSRDKLTQANDAVFRCSDLAGAITRLRAVGTERRAERTDLSRLDLSAIPNGDAIRAALDSALAHSLTADGYYVKWAQEKQGNGCRETATAKSHRVGGDDESQVAGSAKLQFLGLWNPVAAGLGLPTRDRQGI